MLIIGIDPGSKITACGIIDSNTKQSFWELIKLSRKLSQEDKIYSVFKFLEGIIEKYMPDEVAIETPFYSVNIQSAMILSEIKSAAIIASKNSGISIYQYTPRQIKQAICGYGAATKEQLKFVLEKTLKINLQKEPFDVSDALAVALTHIYTHNL